MQLTESFKLHSNELEVYKKQSKIFLTENESLNAEMNGNNALFKEIVEQSGKQVKIIREVIFN